MRWTSSEWGRSTRQSHVNKRAPPPVPPPLCDFYHTAGQWISARAIVTEIGDVIKLPVYLTFQGWKGFISSTLFHSFSNLLYCCSCKARDISAFLLFTLLLWLCAIKLHKTVFQATICPQLCSFWQTTAWVFHCRHICMISMSVC